MVYDTTHITHDDDLPRDLPQIERIVRRGPLLLHLPQRERVADLDGRRGQERRRRRVRGLRCLGHDACHDLLSAFFFIYLSALVWRRQLPSARRQLSVPYHHVRGGGGQSMRKRTL